MNLNVYDRLPEGFLETGFRELERVLPGPSLIRLAGQADPPLLLATLLHGNEPTGLMAVQKLLRSYRDAGEKLPRSLYLFVGNPAAAAQNVRHLPGQLDFNRIWDGGDRPEHRMAGELKRLAMERGLFASIDIHNTSGENPHYGCVNKIDAACIQLASLFSPKLIYFTRPKGVLSSAFAEHVPSITIESGKPEDPYGLPHVYAFLCRVMTLDAIPQWAGGGDGLEVFHSIGRVQVPDVSRIGFSEKRNGFDFCFIDHIDQKNFSELPANALIGWRLNPQLGLRVIDESGQDVAENFLVYVNEEIRLKRAVVPSMFTQDERIVHQDCLGYFMEPYELPHFPPAG